MSKRCQSIDPHVHLRWNEYPHSDFCALGIRDAIVSGVIAVAEQPNTTPALTTPEIAAERSTHVFKTATLMGFPSMGHRIHLGITADPCQTRAAMNAANGIPGGSIKVFWVHSTGNMGIIGQALQRQVWDMVRETGYRRTIIGHFEDESLFQVPFDPRNPITHSLRQCAESEYLQVETQLANAERVGFKGVFYIAHVSNPATLDLVDSWRRRSNAGFRIVTEVTWHHMFLNTDDYAAQGNRLKMNPPLRHPKLQESLLEKVLAGRADLIGSDHAPHPLSRKDDPENPPSGIPALLFTPRGCELLLGMHMSEDVLRRMTFEVANELFAFNCKPADVGNRPYRPELWEDYGWNPFERLGA